MKTRKHRLLSRFLAAVVALGLCTPPGGLTSSVKAAVYTTADGFKYEVINGQAKIYGSTQTGELVFPDEVDGYPVKSIGTYMGSSSFSGKNDEITGITIPETVEVIEDSTFSGFHYLSRVTLSKGLREIGFNAFSQCTSLKHIDIPDTVQSIGDSVFWDSALESISLPDSVESWGETIFWGCSDLKSVSLPSGVKELTGHTFYQCTKLEKVYIPASVTVLHKEAFMGCTALTDIYFGGTQEEWDRLVADIPASDEARKAKITVNATGIGQTDPETPPTEDWQPPMPVLNGALNTFDGIQVRWGDSVIPSLPDIDRLDMGYYILRRQGADKSYQKIATVKGADRHSYEDTAVEPGKTYTYTVQMYVQDKVSKYDEKGVTCTRDLTTQSGVYPNDRLGWSIPNHPYYFGLPDDYAIPMERYTEVLGTKLTDKAFGFIKSRLPANGFCHGMSLIAAGQYLGIIDMRHHLPGSSDALADFAITSVKQSYGTNKYAAFMEDPNVIEVIERAHLSQYTKEFRSAQVYDSQKDYHGVLDYLTTDNKKPLLVTLDAGLEGGHTVLTYPGVAPVKQQDGRYLVFLYDPNVPVIGQNSLLRPYTLENQLSELYTKGGMSYLVLDPKTGRWAYYNPSLDESRPQMSSEYMRPGLRFALQDKGNHVIMQESLRFYDVEKIPSSIFSKLECIGKVIRICGEPNRPASVTVTAASGQVMAGVQWSAAGGETNVTISESMVSDYMLGGTERQELYLWLPDNCGEITVSGSGIELGYLSGSTLLGVQASGSAALQLNPAAASISLKEGSDSEIELLIQRNTADTDEPAAASIQTTAERKDKLTVSLRKDGIPVINGPKDQEYTVSCEQGNSSYSLVNMTEDEINEAFNVPPSGFSDVSPDAYYYDAVQWAVKQGVTTGTSADTFSPNEACTRAQVVTFIWRALELDALDSRSQNNPFRDVSSDAYYLDPVLWAAENGITTGTSANTFSPNEACTRAQVVTFLWRTDFPPKYLNTGRTFRDVHSGDYFWTPVQWALEHDITTGTSADTFSPHEPCTRAQVVTFLYRYFGS